MLVSMQTTGAILLIGLMLATALVLLFGVFSMARGGEFNKKYGNKMMVLRVVLQGGALLLLGVLFLLSQSK